MFTIGETVHYWTGSQTPPTEVTITAITPRQITAQTAGGEKLRFRARDRVQLGWNSMYRLEKLDRAKVEAVAKKQALEALRREILGGCDIGLQAMQQWASDRATLEQLAAEYRTFLRRAIDIGADVPTYLREWLDQDQTVASEAI